jgi:hypothetical protein
VKATLNLPDNAAVVEAALEGLVQADIVLIRSGLVPPYPHDTNVIYQLEPPGEEDWKLAHNGIRDGWMDCEDIAAWVVAGDRVTGQDPGARVVLIKTGPNKLHAVVMHTGGGIEDPCVDLTPKRVRQHA